MTEKNLTELAQSQRSALAAQDEAGAALASSLLESDTDFIAVAQALHGNVPMALWLAFTGALEMCPDHVCDEAICADDEADCEAGQISRERRLQAEQLQGVRELHGEEAAQLVLDGWTIDGAISHVEGTCDRELCTHPAHRVCEWFAGCGQPAELYVSHPILGQVPSCRRCQTVVGR
jgi:hypothetical protein